MVKMNYAHTRLWLLATSLLVAPTMASQECTLQLRAGFNFVGTTSDKNASWLVNALSGLRLDKILKGQKDDQTIYMSLKPKGYSPSFTFDPVAGESYDQATIKLVLEQDTKLDALDMSNDTSRKALDEAWETIKSSYVFEPTDISYKEHLKKDFLAQNQLLKGDSDEKTLTYKKGYIYNDSDEKVNTLFNLDSEPKEMSIADFIDENSSGKLHERLIGDPTLWKITITGRLVYDKKRTSTKKKVGIGVILIATCSGLSYLFYAGSRPPKLSQPRHHSAKRSSSFPT